MERFLDPFNKGDYYICNNMSTDFKGICVTICNGKLNIRDTLDELNDLSITELSNEVLESKIKFAIEIIPR